MDARQGRARRRRVGFVVGALAVAVGLPVALSTLGARANPVPSPSVSDVPGVAFATPATSPPTPPPQVPTASGRPTPGPLQPISLPNLRGWHVPVLMYHVIATPSEAGGALPALVVSPTAFGAQMRTLHAAGWRTITAAALARDMAAGGRPPRHAFVVTLDDGHVNGFTEAFAILRANGFVATYYVVTGRVGDPGYLTAAELVTMAADGMEIADHTTHHIPLASALAPIALGEIVGAEDYLQRLIGIPQVTFAYPFGSWDPAVVSDVLKAGFVIAFTNRAGCDESAANRFTIPRLRVLPSTSAPGLLAGLRACG